MRYDFHANHSITIHWILNFAKNFFYSVYFNYLFFVRTPCTGQEWERGAGLSGTGPTPGEADLSKLFVKKKNWTRFMLCQIVKGPNQISILKCYFLTWCRDSENINCCFKITKKCCFKNIFGACAWWECLLWLKKSKYLEKLKKIYLSFVQVKNHFANFWGLKQCCNIFNFEYSYWHVFYANFADFFWN